MEAQQGDTLDKEIQQASYKKEFYRSLYVEKSAKLPEIWNTGDQA